MSDSGFRERLLQKVAPWKDNFEDMRNNMHDTAAKAKAHAHDLKTDIKCVNLKIQFIGASGLPKMDVVGSADPFFTANIDDKIKYMCVLNFSLVSSLILKLESL